MTVAQMLNEMRDPLGAPMHPVLIQALLVILFVFHIFFVTLAVGCAATTIACLGRRRVSINARRLGELTARLTPNAVGLGVVTGIAPLLFVQTIYDPGWYAANALMGFWSVLFIFVVMGAYAFAYLYSLKGAGRGRHIWAAALSLLLLLLAGIIMHGLAGISIHPEKWLEWYAGSGRLQTDGTAFHAVSAPRLILVLIGQAALSLAVTLIALPWHLRHRVDVDHQHLMWVADRGRKVGMVAGPTLGVLGVWWALTQGSAFGSGWAVGILVISASLVVTVAIVWLRNLDQAPWIVASWLVSVLFIAVAREIVRAASFDRFGYSVGDYPYRWDWQSIAMFGTTTIVGSTVLAYMVAVWFRWSRHGSGMTAEAPQYERLGTIAVAMLSVWFILFAIAGALVLST